MDFVLSTTETESCHFGFQSRIFIPYFISVIIQLMWWKTEKKPTSKRQKCRNRKEQSQRPERLKRYPTLFFEFFFVLFEVTTRSLKFSLQIH
jgi:hypothetical protein